jgi:hypothetical protein
MALNYWVENKVSGTELMAMRMMRGKTYQDMARLSRSKKYKGILLFNMGAHEFKRYEQNLSECPEDVVEFYMRSLGITRSHMAQFKKILKGQLKTFEEGRQVSQSVKKEVKEKYKNKCARCGSKENLHLHHIEHFSKGGQNTTDNLLLLCASCHAEEHRDEHYYKLLKSQAQR